MSQVLSHESVIEDSLDMAPPSLIANLMARLARFPGIVSSPRGRRVVFLTLVVARTVVPAPAEVAAVPDQVAWTFRSLPRATFRFEGWIGQRLDANLHHWLLPAPPANPGMIEMFHARDLDPPQDLVPWAGEFAGKYLVSAVLALRATEDPALESRVREVVDGLTRSQADDGYLGPFPRKERLLHHWDLWGHYHCLWGLLLWHERTGDTHALQSARQAADLICRTYLDSSRRILDAGSPEMNMSIAHALGWLYRITGEARYWRLMGEIQKDWEQSGDYLRSGLAGLEFFESPRPRWESLHDLQSLLEYYRVTGNADYRIAFEQHWRSIARRDVHNTGGFSTGEQAVGSPYAEGPIETCCTVAWMALTLDMLRLTGDARVADYLEQSTYNAALGAQHPSGRWWTYDTPMNGRRAASAHSIVFQARPGTPELNCCSVNGPRALGMISEWALMTTRDGLVLNHFGPASYHVALPDRHAVRLLVQSDYPRDGRVQLLLEQAPPVPFTLHLRIPAWSRQTELRINDRPLPVPQSGQYLSLHRPWRKGDRLSWTFDTTLRVVAGDRERLGQVSLYRGPILLAYDQMSDGSNPDHMLAVDAPALAGRDFQPDPPSQPSSADGPWIQITVPTANARHLRLVDFASAGARGSRYRSWLPAKTAPPPPPIPRQPRDLATLPPGDTLFKWTTRPGHGLRDYALILTETEETNHPVMVLSELRQPQALVGNSIKQQLRPLQWYYWSVIAFADGAATSSARPVTRFRYNPDLPPQPPAPSTPVGPEGLLVHASLAGTTQPAWGRLIRGPSFQAADDRSGKSDRALQVNGRNQMLVYGVDTFPQEDYTATLWLRIDAPPRHRLGQVISAWTGAMDDPLRLVVEDGKLHARIEAGAGYSTAGFEIQPGQWRHVGVVKAGPQLRLYLDGKPVSQTSVPALLHSRSTEIGLGGNPKFEGPEFLPATFAEFKLFERALSGEELSALAASPD